jgi:hypothetical protein
MDSQFDILPRPIRIQGLPINATHQTHNKILKILKTEMSQQRNNNMSNQINTPSKTTTTPRIITMPVSDNPEAVFVVSSNTTSSQQHVVVPQGETVERGTKRPNDEIATPSEKDAHPLKKRKPFADRIEDEILVFEINSQESQYEISKEKELSSSCKDPNYVIRKLTTNKTTGKATSRIVDKRLSSKKERQFMGLRAEDVHPEFAKEFDADKEVAAFHCWLKTLKTNCSKTSVRTVELPVAPVVVTLTREESLRIEFSKLIEEARIALEEKFATEKCRVNDDFEDMVLRFEVMVQSPSFDAEGGISSLKREFFNQKKSINFARIERDARRPPVSNTSHLVVKSDNESVGKK